MTGDANRNGVGRDLESETGEARQNPSTSSTFDVWLLRAGKLMALGLVVPEMAAWGARPQAIGFYTVLWTGLEVADRLRNGRR